VWESYTDAQFVKHENLSPLYKLYLDIIKNEEYLRSQIWES
jgi:hypothetical protein